MEGKLLSQGECELADRYAEETMRDGIPDGNNGVEAPASYLIE